MQTTVKTSTPARGLRGVVLGVALALAGGASLTAWAMPQGGPAYRHGAHGGAMAGSGHHLERMLDAAGASDAQRAQVRQIAQAAHADLKARREAGRALHERQRDLFAAPTVDANAVEALRQQMLAEHDQTSRRMTQAMLDISRVLSPEQRAKVAASSKAHRELMQRQRDERRQLDRPQG